METMGKWKLGGWSVVLLCRVPLLRQNLTSLTALLDLHQHTCSLTQAPAWKEKTTVQHLYKPSHMIMSYKKEKKYTHKRKEEKTKNLLFVKLVPLACLFLLGVIYASKN